MGHDSFCNTQLRWFMVDDRVGLAGVWSSLDIAIVLA